MKFSSKLFFPVNFFFPIADSYKRLDATSNCLSKGKLKIGADPLDS